MSNQTDHANYVLAQITAIAKKYPAVTQVILFGSRATGDAHATSDFDICIKGPSIFEFYSIKTEVEDIATHFSFDILLYDNIDNSLLVQKIDSEGVIIYG